MKNDFPLEIKEAIKGGIDQPFWTSGLKKILEDDIEVLTKRIVGDTDENLEEAERNHLIDLRKIYKNILNLPKKILEEEKKETSKVSNPDPYYKHDRDGIEKES